MYNKTYSDEFSGGIFRRRGYTNLSGMCILLNYFIFELAEKKTLAHNLYV